MTPSLITTNTNYELLQPALKLALEAGRRILEIYSSERINQQTKGDGTPLTEADLAANRVIIDGLHALTPDLPILSEESADFAYVQRKHWSRFWLLDPLDGTKEFISRNGEFTVNIALIENGRPVLGVVHAPVLGVSYFAVKGLGAFRQITDQPPESILAAMHNFGSQLKIVGSRSHADPRQESLFKLFENADLLAMGSSLKFCLIAEGKAHLYPRFGPTMEWDTAAAQCIAEEAGGCVIDFKGQPLRYNKPDLHNPPFFAFAASDQSLQRKLVGHTW